jgi:hypothetical protein
MRTHVVICAFVMVGFLAGSVLADDTFPPPWQRGGDRTTYQDWNFSTSANPTPPDVQNNNSYGIPMARIFDGGWLNYGAGNHVGVWTLFGTDSYIDVPIPNAPDHPDWNKMVWTQLTWSPSSEVGGVPIVSVDGFDSELQETIATHDGWYQSAWLTTLPYNPTFETVHITGLFISVGELVVDTKCVPEPATLSLLALGGLALIRRRK